MRLTLRTLLAYIDQQLSPEDTAELESKIEKSDFARRLQRRINMLSSRRNVPAPLVHVRGVGETNSVAEYIDGEMSTDKIPDFEKACLESDIHLSEVAACHTILTRLGQAEEIAPELRRRIYMLDKFPVEGTVSDSDSNANIESHGAIAERFVDSGEEKIVSSRDVFELSAPSQLRSGEVDDSQSDDIGASATHNAASTRVRYRVLPILAAFASVLMLTFLILLATFDPDSSDLNESGHREHLGSEQPGEKEATSNRNVDSNAENPDGRPELNLSTSVSDEKHSKKLRAGKAAENPATELAVEKQQLSNEVSKASHARDVTANPDVPEEANAGRSDESLVGATDVKDPASLDSSFEPPARLEFFGVQSRDRGLSVAKLSTENQLLARADIASDRWRIVSVGSDIREGEALLLFPYFRPTMAFPSVNLTGCDAGLVEVLAVSERSVPGLSIEHGRFLLSNAGIGFNKFRIDAGDIAGEVTLQSDDAVLAIEVLRYLPTGIDPVGLQASSRVQTELIISGVVGRSMWSPNAGASGAESGPDAQQVDQFVVKKIVSGKIPRTSSVARLPKWMIADSVREIELADAMRMQSLLASTLSESTGSPVGKSFDVEKAIEAITASQAGRTDLRIRQLALLSQLQLGDPGAGVALMNMTDPAFVRPWLWMAVMRIARQHIYRSPKAAAEFRNRLLTDPDGEQIFRMLWGFDNDQLIGGKDASLVEALDDDRLVIRVLAHQTLQAVTGKSLLYRPEQSRADRVKSTEKWRTAVAEEKIRYSK